MNTIEEHRRMRGIMYCEWYSKVNETKRDR